MGWLVTYRMNRGIHFKQRIRKVDGCVPLSLLSLFIQGDNGSIVIVRISKMSICIASHRASLPSRVVLVSCHLVLWIVLTKKDVFITCSWWLWHSSWQAFTVASPRDAGWLFTHKWYNNGKYDKNKKRLFPYHYWHWQRAFNRREVIVRALSFYHVWNCRLTCSYFIFTLNTQNRVFRGFNWEVSNETKFRSDVELI